MRSKYYYLVSSLPYLKFQEVPPISSDELLSECKKWLSGEDMTTIASAHIKEHEEKDEDTEFIRAWKRFNRTLEEDLAKARSGEKVSYKGTSELINEIMEQENPLLKEKIFEKIRWSFLEEMSAKVHFDINWLAFYFLKLQILERLSTFNKDRGEAIFYEICEVKI